MPKRKSTTDETKTPQKRARTSAAAEDDAEMTPAKAEVAGFPANAEVKEAAADSETTPVLKRKGSAKSKAKAKAKAKGKARGSSRKKQESSSSSSSEEESSSGEESSSSSSSSESEDGATDRQKLMRAASAPGGDLTAASAPAPPLRRTVSDGDAKAAPKVKRTSSTGKLPAGEIDEEAGRIAAWPSDLPQASEAKHSIKAGEGTLKIVCYNVAGLRAAAKKGLPEYLAQEKADIVMLSEVKCTQDQNPMKSTGYSHIYWNASTSKAGYSGIAVFSRTKPLSVTKGIGVLDDEGRVFTMDYGAFYLVSAYVPNSGDKLQNLKIRATFDIAMTRHISKLNAEKPVIYCGDLNVAVNAYDVYDGETNRQRKKSSGFSDQERWAFSRVLDLGFVDAYRYKYPDAREDAMTYWSMRFGMKKQNKGWRLDYFVLSPSLLPLLEDVHVRQEVNASDHAPLVLSIRKPEATGSAT